MTLEKAVDEFVRDGLTTVAYSVHKIPGALIEDANSSMKSLIDILRQSNEECALLRKGEAEAEMLLVYRKGKNKDLKEFLHYTHDLIDTPYFNERRKVMSDSEAFHWGIVQKLHSRLNHFTGHFVQSLYDSHRHLFSHDIVAGFTQSIKQVIPYGTTTTRGLWYPAEPGQKGARGHFDRSLLTLHCGDRGGALQGHNSIEGSSGYEISPTAGEVLVFAGVKLCRATEGRMLPLWHSSIGSKMIPRQALVHFAHADVGVTVTDAWETYVTFCEQRGHDPHGLYQRSRQPC